MGHVLRNAHMGLKGLGYPKFRKSSLVLLYQDLALDPYPETPTPKPSTLKSET